MNEMNKLHEMLLKAGINHTFIPLDENFFGAGSLQICIFRDSTLEEELDDVIFCKFSHGHARGLLESNRLSNCGGWETAEQVFEGWMEKFFS